MCSLLVWLVGWLLWVCGCGGDVRLGDVVTIYAVRKVEANARLACKRNEGSRWTWENKRKMRLGHNIRENSVKHIYEPTQETTNLILTPTRRHSSFSFNIKSASRASSSSPTRLLPAHYAWRRRTRQSTIQAAPTRRRSSPTSTAHPSLAIDPALNAAIHIFSRRELFKAALS